MQELTDSDNIAMDRLDEIEVQLMNFDRARTRGEDWRSLVHELFRNVHNLKSLLAMAGHDTASTLIHEFESRLDSLRSGKRLPDSKWTDVMLSAVDAVQSLITKGNDDGEAVIAIAAAQESLTLLGVDGAASPDVPAPKAPNLHVPFPLSGLEVDLFRRSLGETGKPYILEKLVDNTLSDEQIGSLPVFDSIKEFGVPIAWRAQAAGSAGKVLSILFLSALPESELSFAIFDPFYPVSVPDLQKKDVLPHILIVDDDPVALLILQHYLSAYGRVDTAVRGQEALDKFKAAIQGGVASSDAYNVVFLDIMMPGMDGHQTLMRIRETEESLGILVGNGCRVAMASALSDFASISTSFKDLCDVYLVKPFERSTVQEVMGKFGFSPIDIDPSKVL
jgi:two-component system chemotaxis response regulator CheY